MTGVLKPEDERVVTPGKEAVSDLQDLDAPKGASSGWLSMGYQWIAIPGALSTAYMLIEAESSPHLKADGTTPDRASLEQAVDRCGMNDAALPSAPLFLNLLVQAARSRARPGYVDFLLQHDAKRYHPDKRLKDDGYFSYATSSTIDWDRNIVTHPFFRGDPDTEKFQPEYGRLSVDKLNTSAVRTTFADTMLPYNSRDGLMDTGMILNKTVYILAPDGPRNGISQIHFRCDANELTVSLVGDPNQLRYYRGVRLA